MAFWNKTNQVVEEEIIEEDEDDEVSEQPQIITYRSQEIVSSDPDKVWSFCQNSFDSKVRIFDLNQQVLIETTILGDRLDKYLYGYNTMHYNGGSKSTHIRLFNNADTHLKHLLGTLYNGRWLTIDGLLINSDVISKIETIEKIPYQIKFEYKISVALDNANPKNRVFLKESNYQKIIDKHYLESNLAIFLL